MTTTLTRTKFIERHLDKISCLAAYRKSKLLGQGTVGTVVLMCQKANKCVAAKIQVLKDDEEEARFHREATMQTAFAPKAPQVFGHCVDVVAGQKLGTLLMELVPMTLDKYLSETRTATELRRVVQQLVGLVKFAQDNKLVHGDTALFNIGLVSRQKGSPELIFLDFDRSSRVFDPPFRQLDALRLLIELDESTQSRGTVPTHPANIKVLQREAPRVLAKLVGLDPKAKASWDLAWTRAYCEYCEAADVLCLDAGTCKAALKKTQKKKAPIPSSRKTRDKTVVAKLKRDHEPKTQSRVLRARPSRR